MHYKLIDHSEIAEIRVYENTESVAKGSAEYIAQKVKINPYAVISYATGNSKILVYQKIAEMINDGIVDFSKTTAFHLDEYYPCKPSEAHSFVKYLHELVFVPFKLNPSNVFSLNGEAADPELEAVRYDQLIATHPIDVSILGIGPGCHIGFNERGTSFKSTTHLTTLCLETVERDQKERGQNSPTQALTQGIKTILNAKEIILIAYGAKYKNLITEMLYGPIDENCPASALRTVGNKVRIFIDEEVITA